MRRGEQLGDREELAAQGRAAAGEGAQVGGAAFAGGLLGGFAYSLGLVGPCPVHRAMVAAILADGDSHRREFGKGGEP